MTGFTSIAWFLALTVALGGAAAFMSGRSLAGSWRAPGSVALAAVPLAAAARFLHATLAEESTDAVKALITFALMAVFCWLGYALRRRTQMARHYPWLGTGESRGTGA